MPFIKDKRLKVSGEKRIRPDGNFSNYKRKNPKKKIPVSEKSRDVLVSVNAISMSYDGREVLGGLSFGINSGDYLCIVGENGSGKSTLVDGLLGLKRVDSGSIEYKSGMTKKNIGFLPQKTEVQIDFPATVSEIVRSGCVNSSRWGLFFTRENKARAFKNMEKLGITSIAKASFRELSGGQQQRVLLARALCAADKMLVLDEPVTGLDPKATKDMYALIEDINREENMAVVMITHDIPAAVSYATKILYLGKNRYFFGATSEFVEKYGESFGLCRCGKTSEAPYGESDAYRYGGGENDTL